MALAKRVQTSGTDVRTVLIRGRPFLLGVVDPLGVKTYLAPNQ